MNRSQTEQLAHVVEERINALIDHHWKLQGRLKLSYDRAVPAHEEMLKLPPAERPPHWSWMPYALPQRHDTRVLGRDLAAKLRRQDALKWEPFKSMRVRQLKGLLDFACNAHFALTFLLSPGELVRIACLSRFDWRENRYDIIWGAFPDEHRENRPSLGK
jgi:hypothetical protein